MQRLRPPPPLQLGNASENSTCVPAEDSSLQQTASPARPQAQQQSQQAPTIIVTDVEQARLGATREQLEQRPLAAACNPAAAAAAAQQQPSTPTALVPNASSSTSSSMPPPSPLRLLKRADPNTETCAPSSLSRSLALFSPLVNHLFITYVDTLY